MGQDKKRERKREKGRVGEDEKERSMNLINIFIQIFIKRLKTNLVHEMSIGTHVYIYMYKWHRYIQGSPTCLRYQTLYKL